MNKLPQLLQQKKHLLMFLIPLIVSLSVFTFLQKNKRPLPQSSAPKQQEIYHFTTLASQKIHPQIKAYGTLAPANTWDAISQVDGTLTYLNPRLKAGNTIKKGELLWKLDASLQQLELQRRGSEIQHIQSEIEQLQHQLHNEQKLLKLQKQSLQLAQKSAERNQRLHSEGAVTLSRREQEESTLLQQRYQVQALENSLSTLPLKIKTLLSNKKTAETLYKYAQVQLSYYQVHSPLQGIVGDIKLSPGQFITARQRLFQLQGGNILEVEAQLSAKQFKQLFQEGFNAKTLNAKIQHPEDSQEYPAKVSGLREKVSDNTQQLAVVLHIPRQNSGLLKQGSFVNVTLDSTQAYEVFLLPPEAIHGNEVYRLNSENRIEIQRVEVGEHHGEHVIIQAGLRHGDRILTSHHPLIVEGLQIETDQIKP